MNIDKHLSTSQHVVTRQYPTYIQKPTERLSDNRLNDSKSRVIVQPYITNTICTNNYYVNGMIIFSNNNKSTVNHSTKLVRKKKKKFILSNKTTKEIKQTNKCNDQREERECSDCKKISSF